MGCSSEGLMIERLMIGDVVANNIAVNLGVNVNTGNWI